MNKVEFLKEMACALGAVTVPTTGLFDMVCATVGTTNLVHARIKTLCRVGAFDQAAIELLETALPQYQWGRDRLDTCLFGRVATMSGWVSGL